MAFNGKNPFLFPVPHKINLVNLIKRTAYPDFNYDFEGKELLNVSVISYDLKTDDIKMDNGYNEIEFTKPLVAVNFNNLFFINSQADFERFSSSYDISKIVLKKNSIYILNQDIQLTKSLSVDVNYENTTTYIDTNGGNLILTNSLVPLIENKSFTTQILRLNNLTIDGNDNKTTFINNTSLNDPNYNGGMIINNCIIKNFNYLGTQLCGLFYLFNSYFHDNDLGFIFNCTDNFIINSCKFIFTNSGGTHLKFIDSSDSIMISSCEFVIKDTESALNFDNTFTSDNVNINSCNFLIQTENSKVFYTGSYTQKDLNFRFTGNIHVPDSTITGLLKLEENANITSIPDDNAYVRVNGGIGFYITNYERLTSSTTGIVTYTGIEDAILNVDVNSFLRPNIGALKTIYLLVAHIVGSVNYEVTFDNITNTVIRSNHEFKNNEIISFLNSPGNLPTGLNKGYLYYIINSTTNTFQLSYTSGGGIITFTTDGLGSNYLNLVNESYSPSATGDSVKLQNIIINTIFELKTNDNIVVYTTSDDSTPILVYNLFVRISKI